MIHSVLGVFSQDSVGDSVEKAIQSQMIGSLRSPFWNWQTFEEVEGLWGEAIREPSNYSRFHRCISVSEIECIGAGLGGSYVTFSLAFLSEFENSQSLVLFRGQAGFTGAEEECSVSVWHDGVTF